MNDFSTLFDTFLMFIYKFLGISIGDQVCIHYTLLHSARKKNRSETDVIVKYFFTT